MLRSCAASRDTYKSILQHLYQIFNTAPRSLRGLNDRAAGYPRLWVRSESEGGVAKLAPLTERLAHTLGSGGLALKEMHSVVGLAAFLSPANCV